VQGEREIRHPATYARVSSRDQARNLESQISTLKQRFPGAEVNRDTSSGLKFDRQGFLNLLKAVQEKRISSVAVTHRDRLASLAILQRGLRLCRYPFTVSACASWQPMRSEYLYAPGERKAGGAGGTEQAANAPNRNADNFHVFLRF
jgi:hypothetical protein